MERRFLAAALVMIGVSCFSGIATANEDGRAPSSVAEPAWAAKLAKDIERPDMLSAEGQQTCEARVLEALNHRFDLKLEPSDIAPVRAPGWPAEERGFIRGGGYNIRISIMGLSTAEARRIHSGRFIGHEDGHPDSLVASLHVPGKVNGVNTFIRTTQSSGIALDFTAHIDSAYAYTPWGLIAHLFKDVLGADTRDPCPDTGQL